MVLMYRSKCSSDLTILSSASESAHLKDSLVDIAATCKCLLRHYMLFYSTTDRTERNSRSKSTSGTTETYKGLHSGVIHITKHVGTHSDDNGVSER